jgi:hypothetical protein
VDSGSYLLAHGGYFKHSETLDIIGRKLALDWAAHNQRLSEPRLNELYAKYDAALAW